MKKAIVGVLLLGALAGGLVGCGAPETVSSAPETMSSQGTDIWYSNLTDAASQQEVASLLQAKGITKEQTDTLMAWADDFNRRVRQPLPQGTVEMQGSAVDYRDLLFDLKPTTNSSLYEYDPEVNCRLTAFLLLKRHLQTNGTVDLSDTYLMFDIQEIDNLEQFRLSDADRTNFISLYNWIAMPADGTQEEHLASIQQAWKKRGIAITGEGVSLITLYLHSPTDNIRIVGHTGVLLEEGERLLFVEKYGPDGPFQATWFHNRAELKAYLLARPDAAGDGTELPPIAMENDQPL